MLLVQYLETQWHLVPTTGTQIDQTGIITANCTPGTSYTIAMTTTQTGGNYVMNTSPVVDPLNYKLYTNTGRTTEIVAGTQIETNGHGNGNNQNITVYGRLPGCTGCKYWSL